MNPRSQEGFDAGALHLETGPDVGIGAVFNMQNFPDVQWPRMLPVAGNGTVKASGKGNGVVENLSLADGWPEVAAPASKITPAGGVSTNLNYSITPSAKIWFKTSFQFITSFILIFLSFLGF